MKGNRELSKKKKKFSMGAGLENSRGKDSKKQNKIKRMSKQKKVEFIGFLVHLKISRLDDSAFTVVFGKFSQWIRKKKKANEEVQANC